MRAKVFDDARTAIYAAIAEHEISGEMSRPYVTLARLVRERSAAQATLAPLVALLAEHCREPETSEETLRRLTGEAETGRDLCAVLVSWSTSEESAVETLKRIIREWQAATKIMREQADD
jgi:hypothetical protein